MMCQIIYYCDTLPEVVTRMTTFIKTNFKIFNDQTNIDNYRLAANITEYHILSKLSYGRTDGRTDPNCRKLLFKNIFVSLSIFFTFLYEMLESLHYTLL